MGMHRVCNKPRKGGTHVPEEVEGKLLRLLLAADLRILILTHTHSLAQLVSKCQLQLVFTDVLLHLQAFTQSLLALHVHMSLPLLRN